MPAHNIPDAPVFRSTDLRQHLAELEGRPAQTIGRGTITYQLRRLRLHGMIEPAKQPSISVTDRGWRASLFFTLEATIACCAQASPPSYRRTPPKSSLSAAPSTPSTDEYSNVSLNTILPPKLDAFSCKSSTQAELV